MRFIAEYRNIKTGDTKFYTLSADTLPEARAKANRWSTKLLVLAVLKQTLG